VSDAALDLSPEDLATRLATPHAHAAERSDPGPSKSSCSSGLDHALAAVADLDFPRAPLTRAR